MIEENAFDKVDDMLYVGSMHGAFDQDRLADHNISAIVQATCEARIFPRFENIDYFEFGIGDLPSVKISDRIIGPLRFIHQSHLQGKTVLVHCSAGISRSATVACAYLMVKYNLSFRDAYEIVQKHRPVARPNDGFREQLRALDLEQIRNSLGIN